MTINNNKSIRKIVGIRLKTAKKIYNFECKTFVLKVGDQVIVETEQGLLLGIVCIPSVLNNNKIITNSKKRFRKANEKDLIQLAKNSKLEKKAYYFCINNIKKLNLKMHLFSVNSAFDTNRLTFFFTADGRIDFRELVKTLVKKFHSRIEMRQVGVRNQAKMCGGLGRCGQSLCCFSFLHKFEPISIKMAKIQGLSLNPTKISGQCGRLMCCLTFENQVYKKIKNSDLENLK